MDILYKTNKMKKHCEIYNEAKKAYGLDNAEKLHLRIDQIKSASDIDFLIKYNIGGCHKLSGNRKNQYAFHLKHPFRLICSIVDNNISIVCIEEVIDYH